MRVKEFPLRDLNKRAWRAVARELGPAGFVRFLQQYEGGTGDYTRDRHEILASVTAAELEADLKKVRQEIMRDPAMRSKVRATKH
jgi:hypothetical protein